MPELHSKRSGFIYNARGLFTKHHKIIQKFIKTGNLKHFYRNELDKLFFAHNTAYSDNKDLDKRTMSDKILKNWNCNYDGYQRALASMVYKFSDKTTGSGKSVNKQLAEELSKPIINKFKRRKVYGRFKDNIWAADLAEMGSLSSKNKNVNYL